MKVVVKELESLYWEQLEKEEGITKEDIELVDLSIAFSPVIPFKNGPICEVLETRGGNYIIPTNPAFQVSITPESLKVMRFRYLSNRKNWL